MKKYLALFAAMLALSACYKPYESTIDLAVNDTRINLTWAQAQDQLEFVIPVYSTGSWSIGIVAGGDWLSIDRKGGSGREYVHCVARPNTLDVPRAVRLEVSNGKKTIPVYVVTSTADQAAADLDDAELDRYLI